MFAIQYSVNNRGEMDRYFDAKVIDNPSVSPTEVNWGLGPSFIIVRKVGRTLFQEEKVKDSRLHTDIEITRFFYRKLHSQTIHILKSL